MKPPSDRPSPQAGKSPLIPQAGEGDKVSLREFRVNDFHTGSVSQALAIADHPDRDTLDHQFLAREVDLDRLEIRIFR